MKENFIYARTEKGAAEIAQRSQAIPARARSLLMMIDGKSTGAQLLDKLAAFPNSAEFLQLLEDGGYIAPVGGPAAGAVPVAAAAPAAKPAAGGDAGGSGIGAAKRFMTRSLHEIFGPDADSLTGKVDKAQTVAELREVALKHKDLIASMASRSKSEAYWRGIEELLPEL
jgi:hypothetical protein